MTDFKLLICGHSDFDDYERLKYVADLIIIEKAFDKEIIIVSNAEPGAGLLGERYAAERGYEVDEMIGNHAIDMITLADHCLYFCLDPCDICEDLRWLAMLSGTTLMIIATDQSTNINPTNT